jgi:hypothetical protein
MWGSLIKLGITGLVAYKAYEHFSKKKVFISFAMKDRYARDFLVGQSKKGNCPFDFRDYSVHQAWDSKWKTQCRERIKGCDCMIVLVTKHTSTATGQHWEAKCAKDEDIPVRVIYYEKSMSKAMLPPELKGIKTIPNKWGSIAKFINSVKS